MFLKLFYAIKLMHLVVCILFQIWNRIRFLKLMVDLNTIHGFGVRFRSEPGIRSIKTDPSLDLTWFRPISFLFASLAIFIDYEKITWSMKNHANQTKRKMSGREWQRWFSKKRNRFKLQIAYGISQESWMEQHIGFLNLTLSWMQILNILTIFWTG